MYVSFQTGLVKMFSKKHLK